MDNKKENKDELFFMDNELLRLMISDIFQVCILVNLTKSKYRIIEYGRSYSEQKKSSGYIEDFVETYSSLIPDELQREKFKKVFSMKSLIHAYRQGDTQISLKYQQIINNSTIHWIETKGVFVKNDSKDIQMVFLSRFIDEEMEQLNHIRLLLKKESIYKTAINSDASGYFEVNLSKDLIIGRILDYRDSKDRPVEVKPDIKFPYSYSEFINWSIDNIFKSDIEGYTKNTDRDFLISKFRAGERMHEVTFCTKSISGHMHYHKQIYFLSIDERTGDIIALCVLKDISDFQRKEVELKRNHRIISVLSQEYTTVFYVDMNYETAIPYRMSEAVEKAFYASNFEEYKYSKIIKAYVEKTVIEGERESFLEAVSLDNIKKQLRDNDIYRIPYHSDIYGFVSIYEMKFAKIGHGEEIDAIVVGISNKDEEFRKENELRSRMTQDYDIINVLASEYEFMLYIDLKTDKFMTYSMNSNAAKILKRYMDSGMTYTEIRLIYVNKWIIEEDREKMFEVSDVNNLKKQLTERRYFAVTFRGLNDDGDIHYYEMKAFKVGDDAVTESIVLGISDKDSEIRRRNEYNRQLEEARHKAEEANKAKSTFLFNMSHDIRTPMNAILGFTSMAKKYLYDPMHVSECLDKVELSGNHLLSLINDILDMARIENNKIIIEETPNNIRYNFEQFIEIMQPSAEEKDIELSLQLKNITDEDIYVDALRLNRVIMNIMSNSLKYTKPGGSITVTVEQKQSDRPGFGAYDLIFSDTGIGMSKKFIETIFDSFTREKTSTVSGIQGTGLGMAITKNFVELMGGTIEIDSALGLGTTVTCHMYFRLQQIQDVIIEEDETDDDVDFKEIRVLLVEDNELNREIAKDILEELGIIVEEANDGSVAVDMVCMKPENYYDMVFMDIQMPYMDGYKACQAIRSTKNKEVSSVPIIAMTANAFEEDKRKALEAGMDAHLAKPLNVPHLIKTIKRFIRKK